MAIPTWAKNLGFVDEKTRRDVLAGAAALIQLSDAESLSLVTLEAWAQGTPVIVNDRSEVLRHLVDDSGGGGIVNAVHDFSLMLDSLWHQPQEWVRRGKRGQAYIRRHFQSIENFVQRLEQALHMISLPLAERMRQQGRNLAKSFEPVAWRTAFSRIVEDVLDAPPPHPP
ncbi:MAG: hypothetical protein KatS3mg105_4285 [Gemmatales bacterium]|nr:MAG: hypothetical protein KatS3mg105_4285 [Gemmatales bacterium]